MFGDQGAKSNKVNSKPSTNPSVKIKQQMDIFIESLKAGKTIDVTAKNLLSGHEAVITLESEFLSDPMMSDLVDGKFHVLGKVIRSIDDDTDSISLMRKTALSKMPASLLSDVFGHLSNLGTEQGFQIPQLRWNIDGPAIQIIPIAIYA